MSLGDIPGRDFDPMQKRYDIREAGKIFPSKPAVSGLGEKPPDRYIVRKPTHIDPPVNAVNVDIFNSAVGTAVGVGATVDIVTYTVPMSHIFILKGIGNNLESTAAYLDIAWTLGGTIIEENYREFRFQLGEVIAPFRFAMPLLRKGGMTITLSARNAGAAGHTAFARMIGYIVPVKESTSDGSYREFYEPV